MIITKLQDCSGLVLTSDLIDFYVQNSNHYILGISVVINCCSDPYIYGIEIVDENLTLSIPGASFTLTPEFFNFTEDVILDGIYNVTLTLTQVLTGSSETEQTCHFVDCQTKCLVQEYIRDNVDYFNVFTTYTATTWAEECDDCDCNSSCVLYDRLRQYLLIANPELPGCDC